MIHTYRYVSMYAGLSSKNKFAKMRISLTSDKGQIRGSTENVLHTGVPLHY